jgi:ADP-heptose:LPS heptosyltransferase
MHIGAGKLKNRWPAERFAGLARQLRDREGARIVLCWGPRESDLAAEFSRNVDFDVMKVAPGGLRRLAAFLTMCDLLICNDTGIMHLAASVGVPLVAVFGPTDPVEWKPVGDSFAAVRGADETVGSVTVEEVLQIACAMLRERRNARPAPQKAI